MLLSILPHNVVDIDNFQKCAVKLSFGNEKVAKANYSTPKELNQTIIQIRVRKYAKLWCILSQNCSDDSTEGVTTTPEIFSQQTKFSP